MKLVKIGALAGVMLLGAGAAQAETVYRDQVQHIVLFDLVDDSPAAVDALVSGCYEYLADIDGVYEINVGVRQADRTGGANATDYDVALTVTLADEAAHVAYDTDPSHMTFIGLFRDNWESVRVFDSALTHSPE